MLPMVSEEIFGGESHLGVDQVHLDVYISARGKMWMYIIYENGESLVS